MGLIVVDASVAAKWALGEADSPAALALLDGGDLLLAPDLLLVEVAGAITRAVRHGRLAADRADETLETWLRGLQRGAVELTPSAADLKRATAISCALGHAVPDCLYLALAERVGAGLLTADATFARRAAAWSQVRLFGSTSDG